ncbi:MAG: hypothetical protein ACREDS_00765 [Limisphaerales bacterium]
MKSPSCASINRPLTQCAAMFLFAAFALAGCKRSEIKVYQIQNEQPSASAPNEMTAANQNGNAPPQLQFSTPANWRQIAPSQMRVASFAVTNANGQTADVGVIPLPAGENELALVNMWRGQMQLPTLTNETAAETVSVGNDSAKLFDIASDAPLIDGKFRARILVAELTRGGTSWFFKMTGEDSFVASQKTNFLQFLKSVSFGESASAQMANAPATQNKNQNASPNASSIWTVPADWKPLPPAEFLLAEFSIAGTNGANADVNVAELAGEGGGLLANVNRWRGQLGLPQISETDLQPLINSIDAPNGKISVVDFTGKDSKTGKPTRLIGAVVPQNGQTWFYKLMGDETVVAQQKDAFIKFIRSANYANAH